MSLTERQLTILSHCEEARTLQELMEHFQVSHMTMRREIEKLEQTGLLGETAWRRGKSKLYKTKLLSGKDLGTYNIRQFNASVAPVTLVTNSEYFEKGIEALGKIPRFAVAKILHEYAVRTHLPTGGPQLFSGFPSVEETKRLVKFTIKVLEQLLELFHDLDNMPSWEKDEWISTIYGSTTLKENVELWEKIDKSVIEFGEVISERGWEKVMGMKGE